MKDHKYEMAQILSVFIIYDFKSFDYFISMYYNIPNNTIIIIIYQMYIVPYTICKETLYGNKTALTCM